MVDRSELAAFLRTRRAALQPEDVGLPRAQRRRTQGLRREEVAALCHMSTDYYTRLEQERGPHPSPQMIAAIAQGLHLNLDERDHLFRLVGHQAPPRGFAGDHISPGMLRILDRLSDTAAEIVTELGETLRQTPLAAAVTGDTSAFAGPERSVIYRWFTDPASRTIYPEQDHAFLSTMFASGLRAALALRGPGSRAAEYADLLLTRSDEFRRLWREHAVGVQPQEAKRFVHPQVGLLELNCQHLIDPHQSHILVVYTAQPGSESYDKLQLLSVVTPPPSAGTPTPLWPVGSPD
ncbi:helix-turn-helix transcriptional regulator [Tsukamurella spumae]|uniref:Helix-turn-helix domain-containing protein n=1 Tax=Tsukamurella spumae TaxID=44753 RepID=A0A846X2Y4_9ACTN|nr:helix-turn-helix domain-containing protein [Tsukamurella spumae]NKY19704.1 helix-turn-helix domain-containing protein [Tsukamurella spumae]